MPIAKFLDEICFHKEIIYQDRFSLTGNLRDIELQSHIKHYWSSPFLSCPSLRASSYHPCLIHVYALRFFTGRGRDRCHSSKYQSAMHAYHRGSGFVLITMYTTNLTKSSTSRSLCVTLFTTAVLNRR